MPDEWVHIRIFGALDYRRKVLRGAHTLLQTPLPTLNKIADDLMRVTEINWLSENRRGGGSWKALSPAYEEAKIAGGYDMRMMVRTNTLLPSMTIRGAEFQDLEVGNNEISLDTTVPYAEEAGAARPFNEGVIPSDRDRWARWIAESVAEAMSGRI